MRKAYLATLLSLAACTPPPPQCVRGQSAACTCPGGGMGAQVCNASGGYDPCVCSASDVTVSDAVDTGALDANTDSSVDASAVDVVEGPVEDIDLLLVVDNSNSMRDNQANFMREIEPLLLRLTNPPCTSATNPTPHTCDANNSSDRRVARPVRSLNVGVVSTDLGAPTGPVALGCANIELGDDGNMNPIRFGGALASHLPWTVSPAPPAGFRPASCDESIEGGLSTQNLYPNFITYNTSADDTAGFAEDFSCNAGIYVKGCPVESQLEAVWRALIWHGAGNIVLGPPSNAGFVRPNAVLAIVMLTDEEDGSVRNCAYDIGNPTCNDARSVYQNATAGRWPAVNADLRMYHYMPCSNADPTWNLDRYIDPDDASKGIMALKPGHPERIIFAAITGVPIDVPGSAGPSGRYIVDWDRLLGPPGPNGADDFCGRLSQDSSLDLDTPEGHTSMKQFNVDPDCLSVRVVPSCRREGSTPPEPGSTDFCFTTGQYFALPSRRIVEVARRFDRAPLCNGSPCENGLVSSICKNDYSESIGGIAGAISRRLSPP